MKENDKKAYAFLTSICPITFSERTKTHYRIAQWKIIEPETLLGLYLIVSRFDDNSIEMHFINDPEIKQPGELSKKVTLNEKIKAKPDIEGDYFIPVPLEVVRDMLVITESKPDERKIKLRGLKSRLHVDEVTMVRVKLDWE